MLIFFGGSVADLTPMLTEERFSEHWEPNVRSRYGLTMAKFNALAMRVEMGVNTKKIEQSEAKAKAQRDSVDPMTAETAE
jgi:hypothetical protein